MGVEDEPASAERLDDVVAQRVLCIEIRQRLRGRVLGQVFSGRHHPSLSRSDHIVAEDGVVLVLRGIAHHPAVTSIETNPVDSKSLRIGDVGALGEIDIEEDHGSLAPVRESS